MMSLRKNKFIILFIMFHVAFIFLQIFNHAQHVAQTYQRQHYEKKYIALQEKRQKLIQQFYTLKDRAAIKKFAQDKLQMQLNRLDQVKQISKT